MPRRCNLCKLVNRYKSYDGWTCSKAKCCYDDIYIRVSESEARGPISESTRINFDTLFLFWWSWPKLHASPCLAQLVPACCGLSCLPWPVSICLFTLSLIATFSSRINTPKPRRAVLSNESCQPSCCLLSLLAVSWLTTHRANATPPALPRPFLSPFVLWRALYVSSSLSFSTAEETS